MKKYELYIKNGKTRKTAVLNAYSTEQARRMFEGCGKRSDGKLMAIYPISYETKF